MKRDCYQKLISWKHDPYRKPLILRGARQVGKTYLLREFAQEYTNNLYVNFEKMPKAAAVFVDDLEPRNIISRLQAVFEVTINSDNTLLIFDEIQECPAALTSLKYFHEEANQYHVAAAGSLLGIKLNRDAGFPVGKVDFLDLKPLTFFEFLDAVNATQLRATLEQIKTIAPIGEALHQKALDLLKQYLLVGGMPEVVARFVADNNFNNIRKVQQSILDTYVLDFAKHASKADVMKTMAVWDAIPSQLAKENKKFIFSVISKSSRGREYASAIQWLVDAGLIYKSYNISAPKIPLDGYANKDIFKIYMLDVGLLGYLSGLPTQALISPIDKIFAEFKGALMENFVAQELAANNYSQLYYWTSQSVAEVDFIIAKELDVFPLEVKAGSSKKKKSLQSYGAKYQHKILARASAMNLKQDGSVVNFPLYLIKLFPGII